MKNEIKLSFYTVENLFNTHLWFDFFTTLENLLNTKLTHLDIHDPIRNKVANLDEAAGYICSISEQEGSRRLFGKFGKSKVEIGISIFKDNNFFPNNVSLFFPDKTLDSDIGKILIYDVFVDGIKYLRPFYALCDVGSIVARKRKSSGFAVDLQAELIGLFWLTYFNKCYEDFFGLSKFDALLCEKAVLQDGIVIKLGKSPFELDLSRENAESLLGKESFVEPELGFDKPIGKNVLLFKNILETQ